MSKTSLQSIKEVDNVESIITPSLKNFTTVEMFFLNFEQLDFIKLTNILNMEDNIKVILLKKGKQVLSRVIILNKVR
jgi:hypothetical protein